MQCLIEELNGLIGKPPTRSEASYDYTPLKEMLDETGAALEGYVSWVAEKYGVTHIRSKLLAKDTIRDFKRASEMEVSALPQHIVNAGTIFANISESGLLDDKILERLLDMAMPHALYFLFAAEGVEIKKLRAQARRYALTFPSAILQLPDSYLEVAKRLVGEV